MHSREGDDGGEPTTSALLSNVPRLGRFSNNIKLIAASLRRREGITGPPRAVINLA
jgi:hypothetical protein